MCPLGFQTSSNLTFATIAVKITTLEILIFTTDTSRLYFLPTASKTNDKPLPMIAKHKASLLYLDRQQSMHNFSRIPQLNYF